MNATPVPHDKRLAEEILGVLPEGSVARACSDDPATIRFAVRSAGLKLRAVVLNRSSLRRLVSDPARDIKIEYLKRDLLRSATRRAEYVYPRPARLASRAEAERARLAAASL